jgi:hypothetical protein
MALHFSFGRLTVTFSSAVDPIRPRRGGERGSPLDLVPDQRGEDRAVLGQRDGPPRRSSNRGRTPWALLIAALDACVARRRHRPVLGLHGLARQRAVTADFPWPPDITERLITPLAHLIGQAPGSQR